jgi:hypothetical protein
MKNIYIIINFNIFVSLLFFFLFIFRSLFSSLSTTTSTGCLMSLVRTHETLYFPLLRRFFVSRQGT